MLDVKEAMSSCRATWGMHHHYRLLMTMLLVKNKVILSKPTSIGTEHYVLRVGGA